MEVLDSAISTLLEILREIDAELRCVFEVLISTLLEILLESKCPYCQSEVVYQISTLLEIPPLVWLVVVGF